MKADFQAMNMPCRRRRPSNVDTQFQRNRTDGRIGWVLKLRLFCESESEVLVGLFIILAKGLRQLLSRHDFRFVVTSTQWIIFYAVYELGGIRFHTRMNSAPPI
jgi:hypothetical protein